MLAWMKAACVLAACGLFLAGCASDGTINQSSDKPLVISPGVAAHFKQYQREVDAGNSAAFAVNEGGTASYYEYCLSGNCRGRISFYGKALEGCEEMMRGRCLILAVNGVVKRPYTVAESRVASQPEIGVPVDFVSGDRIRQELSGNSIVEANFEGKIWAEYFDPSGALRGRTEDGRLFDGAWNIDGNTLCVDYHSIARDWCGQFAEASDGSIDYYKDGKFRKNYSRSVLQTGNSQNL